MPHMFNLKYKYFCNYFFIA